MMFARGMGIEQFEIVGRGGDAALGHLGERSFGKALFAIRLEHDKSPLAPALSGTSSRSIPRQPVKKR